VYSYALILKLNEIPDHRRIFSAFLPEAALFSYAIFIISMFFLNSRSVFNDKSSMESCLAEEKNGSANCIGSSCRGDMRLVVAPLSQGTEEGNEKLVTLKKHTRNRSWDSSQINSFLLHDDIRLGIGDSVDLHFASAAVKPMSLFPYRGLSMKLKHECHQDCSVNLLESQPGSGDSKLKCVCSTNSDDSGICSGASGTTGSETDDVISASIVCDNDEDVEEVDYDKILSVCDTESPRLSLELDMDPTTCSNLVAFSEHFSGGEDREMTTSCESNSVYVSQETTDLEGKVAEPSKVDHDKSFSESEPPHAVVTTSLNFSLLNRIRANTKTARNSSNSKACSSTASMSGSTNSNTSNGVSPSTNIATGMRSKLRLKLGNSKNKSKAGSSNFSENSKDVVEGGKGTQEKFVEPTISKPGCSISTLSSGVVTDNTQEIGFKTETVDSVGNLLSTVDGSTKDELELQAASKQQSWLLRFFESQVFNMSFAVGYLFTSKEPGVQQYIGI